MTTEAADASNVTYVAGKAVEQTEALDSGVEADVREDAMAAVREAIENAGKEAAEQSKKVEKDPFKPPGAKKEVERGEDGKFKPAGKKEEAVKDEEEEEVDPDKASVSALLRKREKIAKKDNEFQKQLAEQRKSIQEETARARQELQQAQQLMRQLEQEKQKLALIKSNPALLLKEQGLDPEQFILDLAEDGTPQGQLRKQQRELQEQLAEIKNWKAEQAKQVELAQQQAQIGQIQAYRNHVEKQFLDSALNQESSPLTSMFFGKHKAALIAFGDHVAAEFRELSNGREADIQDIVKYIEEELADGVKSWYEKNHGVQKAQTPSKTPPKKVKGSTLSPEMSGERRALSKTFKDLDDEERLEAAKRSVGVALASVQADD